MPEMFSARLPTTAATLVRVWRKAALARPAKRYVANAIRGSTEKVNNARRGLIDTITATMPASSSVSPSNVTTPCDSKSLITSTSLITRDTVTPMIWRSW